MWFDKCQYCLDDFSDYEREMLEETLVKRSQSICQLLFSICKPLYIFKAFGDIIQFSLHVLLSSWSEFVSMRLKCGSLDAAECACSVVHEFMRPAMNSLPVRS